MGKDPAFLFYFQDFAFGTRRMDRRHKGALIDLMIEQADFFVKGKEFKMSLSYIKEVLTSDFDVWKKLEKKYTEEDGLFWNEPLLERQIERRDFSLSRSANRLGKKNKKKKSLTSDKHMVDVNEDVIKDKDRVKKIKYAEKVYMTEKQWNGLLVNHYKNDPKLLAEGIERLDAYKTSSGKTYKDDAGAMRGWVKRDMFDEKVVTLKKESEYI